MHRLMMLAFGLAMAAGALCTRADDPPVQTTTNAAEDQKIDVKLKALREPVRQPVEVEGKGAPAWPLYKEEPPAAQQDFRPPPPAPEPVRRDDRDDRDDEDEDDEPVPPPPPPPPPCTPNNPNWPNC